VRKHRIDESRVVSHAPSCRVVLLQLRDIALESPPVPRLDAEHDGCLEDVTCDGASMKWYSRHAIVAKCVSLGTLAPPSIGSCTLCEELETRTHARASAASSAAGGSTPSLLDCDGNSVMRICKGSRESSSPGLNRS
jgi:hypothetical protein